MIDFLGWRNPERAIKKKLHDVQDIIVIDSVHYFKETDHVTFESMSGQGFRIDFKKPRDNITRYGDAADMQHDRNPLMTTSIPHGNDRAKTVRNVVSMYFAGR